MPLRFRLIREFVESARDAGQDVFLTGSFASGKRGRFSMSVNRVEGYERGEKTFGLTSGSGSQALYLSEEEIAEVLPEGHKMTVRLDNGAVIRLERRFK